MTETPRVLFIYAHLPHYRYGVFMQLQGAKDMECDFAADIESRDGSIPTIPPSSLQRFHRLRNHWMGPFLWQSGLITLLRKKHYTSIVFLGDASYVTTWLATAYCRLRGTHTLFWTIGWHRTEKGPKKWTRLLYYRLPHGLLLYSNAGLRKGIEAGYPPMRMRVIGNSYSSHLSDSQNENQADFESFTKQLQTPSKNVLTAVVRIDKQRRFDLLLMAAAALQAEGLDVTVVLVGAGPELASLQTLATTLNVDLRTPGPAYSDAHLQAVYSQTAITVVPIKAGLTTIQSLTHGRPVVTSDKPENQGPETEAIKPGYTGSFYSDGSIESLVDTIRDWLNRMQTDQSAVAEACQREVRNRWSINCQAQAITAAITGDNTRNHETAA